MPAPRVPPWAYTVVVVACALGTLGLLNVLGIFRAAPRAAGPAPEQPEVRPGEPVQELRSPVDPATLPPHRAAARNAALAALLPIYDAANADRPTHATGRRAVEAYALYLAHAHPPDTL